MSNSRKNGSHQGISTAVKAPAKRASTPMRTSPVPAPAAKPIPASQSRPDQSQLKSRGVEVSRQAIAEAAYFLWLQRGGNELSNWLEAEATLKSRAGR